MSEETLYTVSQLATILGITARTLRFYEDKNLISPRRVGNARVYTDKDRARMILILRGKQLGFSLRDIREYLDLYRADPSQRAQTQLLLDRARERIQTLEAQKTALETTLRELRDMETQCLEVLEGKKRRIEARTA